MNKTRLEILVGFFVLLAIAIFFVIIFFISGVYFLRAGYYIKATFNYTAGLDKGAPVRIAGLRVGEVNKVYVKYDEVSQKPKAIAELWLREDVNVRENSKVYILGAFALNETHIEIISAGETEGRLLQDGDSIMGIDPVPMEMLMEKGIAIAKSFETMATKMDKILGDEKTQEALHLMILDMSELLRYMNQMIIEKKLDINTVVDNVNAVVDDMETSLDHLQSILATIDQGEGTLGQLIKNDELYVEMKELVREIKLHPWRLMKKDKRRDDEQKETEEEKKKR
ncbi:MAG: MCE family protein [Candidatus Omnitrophica bacterium]|nr:MCE family protein [Candidatus Omnitrophota bacterium]